jgi:hypothetical protein
VAFHLPGQAPLGWADIDCAHSTCHDAALACCHVQYIIISLYNHYVSRKARACVHATSSGGLPRKHTDFAYVYIRLRMSHTYIYVCHFHKHTFWPIPTSVKVQSVAATPCVPHLACDFGSTTPALDVAGRPRLHWLLIWHNWCSTGTTRQQPHELVGCLL